jgi:hypothetical protein
MPIPREDVTRLLDKIDQQLPGYYEHFEKLDKQSDEAQSVLYGLVCLQAAQLMAKDKLNSGDELPDDDWFALLSLYRLSNSWFG